MKILLAEDDEAICTPVETILVDHGYDVICVTNEDDLQKRASECDLWIIDVRLPSSGYEGILAVF